MCNMKDIVFTRVLNKCVINLIIYIHHREISGKNNDVSGDTEILLSIYGGYNYHNFLTGYDIQVRLSQVTLLTPYLFITK